MRAAAALGLLAALPATADVSITPDRVATFLVHTLTGAGELRTGVLGVDLAARRIAWRRETRDTFEVRVPRLGSRLYLPHGRDGRLECLHAPSGRVIWEAVLSPFRVVAPLAPDRVAVAGRSTEVTCFRRGSDGALEKVWSVGLEGEEARDLVVTADRILVPTYRALYCLRASDGAVLWRHAPPVAACTYAIVSGDRVVSWDWWGARLEALSLESGEVAWRETAAAPWVFGLHGGRILVRSGPTGRVRGLDPATGAEAWGAEELGPQVVLGGSTDDLAYMPFAGPAAHRGQVWLLSRDRLQAQRLDPATGGVRARRTFDQPLVGAAPAGPFTCFAEPSRLHFVSDTASWSLDLPQPILHLRQLARP
jgi:hypothetical protein